MLWSSSSSLQPSPLLSQSWSSSTGGFRLRGSSRGHKRLRQKDAPKVRLNQCLLEKHVTRTVQSIRSSRVSRTTLLSCIIVFLVSVLITEAAHFSQSMSSISSTHSAIADPIMSEKPAMETEASPRQSDSEEIETARKDDDVASSDSGSLTQRAALIRDELLGNDSLEQDSVHGSAVSSGTSEGGTAHSSLQEGSQDDKDDLEERLKTSSIAQSLRHIALAFDEKVSSLFAATLVSRRRMDLHAHHSQSNLRPFLQTNRVVSSRVSGM